MYGETGGVSCLKTRTPSTPRFRADDFKGDGGQKPTKGTLGIVHPSKQPERCREPGYRPEKRLWTIRRTKRKQVLMRRQRIFVVGQYVRTNIGGKPILKDRVLGGVC